MCVCVCVCVCMCVRPYERIGLSVPFDVLAEFVQPQYRGRALMSVEYFWTVGTMFSAGMAWIMLDSLGWRYESIRAFVIGLGLGLGLNP